MPQLDTVHTLTTYLWTWLTIIMITLKIKTFMLTNKPKKQNLWPHQSTTPPTPWT
uniref:ATP synthase F0 subunit 8 n=1 Tax=Lachesis muta TaxID=8752 RepID=UPI0026E2994B|nr:ATP synthase F0 subunit 8 [Lachesis muta]WJM74499.1 ATP synthase F0 subunit 8 [Lachesis muta]